MSFCHRCAAQSNRNAAESLPSELDDDISSLREMLGTVPDSRLPQGRQHELQFVLGVCVAATLAGAKGYSEIARKAKDMSQALLEKLGAGWSYFERRYKCPSKGTIRRVLSQAHADGLDEATGAWLASRAKKNGEGEWHIAIDGKVLRGAWTDGNEQVTLLSAMIREQGVTIAQVRVPGDTNEITQADALLNALPVPEDDPAVFTLDAAHTQVETARAIKKRPEWEYIMSVKGNQPGLMMAVFEKTAQLTKEKPHDIMEEEGRGRLKRWSCWITGAEGIEFPGAKQAAIILREIFDATGLKVSKEMALLLTGCDASKMNAASINFHERSHWGIENKNHYIRDTVYREDHGQAWQGDGPRVLATIRNLAISLIRQKGVNAIKETTEWIAGDTIRALSFMGA